MITTDPAPIDRTIPAPDFPVELEADADAVPVPLLVPLPVVVVMTDAPPLRSDVARVEEAVELLLAVMPVTRSGTAGPVV